MAAAFGAIGTKSAGGTTSLAIPHPASVGAGDLLVAARAVWLNTGTCSRPSTWTAGPDGTGGTGTASGNHTGRARGDYKQAAGGETGNLATTQAGTLSGAVGQMLRYTKAAGEFWQVQVVAGVSSDTSHAANRAGLSTSGSLTDVQAGDIIVAITEVDTSTSLTITSPYCTIGSSGQLALTRRTSGAGVATGLTGNVEVFDRTLTAGDITAIGAGGTMAFAMTTATSQCGPTVFLRLRARVNTGTATLQLPQLGVAGAADVYDSGVTGAADVVLPQLQLTGAGVVTAGGVGALPLPLPVVTGSAIVRTTGAAAFTLPQLQLAGLAGVADLATGALPLPQLQASGTAAVRLLAAGAPVLPQLQVSGFEQGQSIGALVLPQLAVAGAGQVRTLAAGALGLPQLTAAGVALVRDLAAGQLELPQLQLAAAAGVRVVAVGALQLPMLVVEGTTAAGEFPAVVVVASGRPREVLARGRARSLPATGRTGGYAAGGGGLRAIGRPKL